MTWLNLDRCHDIIWIDDVIASGQMTWLHLDRWHDCIWTDDIIASGLMTWLLQVHMHDCHRLSWLAGFLHDGWELPVPSARLAQDCHVHVEDCHVDHHRNCIGHNHSREMYKMDRFRCFYVWPTIKNLSANKIMYTLGSLLNNDKKYQIS